MNAFLATVVLLTALTQSSNSAAIQPFSLESSSRTVQQSAPAQSVAAAEQVLDGLFSYNTPVLGEQPAWERARETVLVIPSPDLAVASLEQLTEDLAVMCRIFDKSLLPARFRLGTSASTGQIFSYVIGRQTSAAQGLYLDDYGVLFFLQVDYPLVPTQQQDQQQSQPQEQGDPVWSQTIEEMTGQAESGIEPSRPSETYDPQKVERLTRTLIKTLAHAANIRARRPQDVITLVVGPLDDNRTSSYSRRLGGRGTTTALQYGRSSSSSSAGGATSAPAAAPALLVLRVAKTDVDAFAKGQLTLAQFTDKVQTISTPIEQGPPTAGAPTTGLRTR